MLVGYHVTWDEVKAIADAETEGRIEIYNNNGRKIRL
jgi:Uma2 family endonuclease